MSTITNDIKSGNKELKNLINKDIPEIINFIDYIKSINCISIPEFYIYENRIYVNGEFMLYALKIDKQKMKRDLKKVVYFITIDKKKILVNKYGINTLIAKTKTEVPLKFYDSINETIYLLEKSLLSKTKNTNRNDDISDDNLKNQKIKSDYEEKISILQKENQKIKSDYEEKINTIQSELDIFKSVDIHNKNIIDEKEETIRELQDDISIIKSKYNTIKSESETLHLKYTNLEKEFEKLKSESKKIVKYVKSNNKINNSTLNDLEKLDLYDSDIEDTEFIDKTKLREDALLAKNYIKSNGKIQKPKYKNRNTKQNKTSNNEVKKRFYCMKEIKPIFVDKKGRDIFKWNITEQLPFNNKEIHIDTIKYKSFKEYCEDYKLGGLKSFKYQEIWHCDIILTNERYYLLSSIIDLLKFCDEPLLNNIVEIFDLTN